MGKIISLAAHRVAEVILCIGLYEEAAKSAAVVHDCH